MISTYGLSLFLHLLSLTHLEQAAALSVTARGVPQGIIKQACVPFETSFPTGSVAPGAADFVPYNTERNSYAPNPGGGLDLYLGRPSGTITRKGRVNSVVASGATVNSTFLTLYGKFSFEPRAPIIPGVVVAAILTAPGGDETDIELLGGDPTHWQTNIFAPQPGDTKPLYGVFGGLEPFSPGGDSLETFHTYTIDWNANRIIWGVDGKSVRTVNRSETKKNGRYHYPSHPMRVQLGIWDASSPEGTSEWAKGPINWSTAPSRIIATFKSARVQC